MKTFLTLLIAVAATFATAGTADAGPRYHGHTYVSGRTSCGCPVYSQRFVAYYDRCGTPVYSVRRLPAVHRCRGKARARVYYNHVPRRTYSQSRTYYRNGYGRTHSRGYRHGYQSRCR
ncbi:MAG: hypothetical protein AAGI48_07805 [Verrucomicrobiota bacterium]